MKTIAVIARKGGSGKTTVAVHLALAAHAAGFETMLADTDPQGSSFEVLSARPAEQDGPRCSRVMGRDMLAFQRKIAGDYVQACVIDTPAAIEADIAHAIILSHLSVLVVRPTFLDIAACLHTADILRRLRKPGVILLNQAPSARAGVESPSVQRALEALQLVRLPVISTILRSRTLYQTALASGRSAGEQDPDSAAAHDFAQVWKSIEQSAFDEAPIPRDAYPRERQISSARAWL